MNINFIGIGGAFNVELGNNASYIIEKTKILFIDMGLDTFDKIGITAGASAPEYLIEELIKEFEKRYDNINIHNVIVAEENIDF